MQLHFVLQLQMVEATTPIKVEVKESQVKIGDSTIADLNNVPLPREYHAQGTEITEGTTR